MINYIIIYYSAVEYYLLHYVLKHYDIQKQRKKFQISNKELDYLEIYKYRQPDKKRCLSLTFCHPASLTISIPRMFQSKFCERRRSALFFFISHKYFCAAEPQPVIQ